MTRGRVTVAAFVCAVAVAALGAALVLGVRSAANDAVIKKGGAFSPVLHTNERFLDEIRNASLDLDDIDAVFSYVFSQLSETVNVYPTENYYYFRFYANGQEVWGNIRLDSLDRRKGLVSFAYFAAANRTEPYFNYGKTWHRNFGIENGLLLRMKGPLEYTVTYGGKTVTFLLNDVPQTLPADFKLHDGEVFVARTFDESGFQFVLLYDERDPAFRFVLDESAPLSDVLMPYGKDITVGQRSGFAFYEESGMDRRVLFGVDERNVNQNNYYDGPFDQLADNFVDTRKFEEYVVSVFPSLKGKVRGRGDFLDARGERISSRVLLSPYMSYGRMAELWEHMADCQKRFAGGGKELLACVTRDKKHNR